MISNNFTTYEDNKINYCRICANNGFPDEAIIFRSEGTKPNGSTQWALYDYLRPLERYVYKSTMQENTNPISQVQSIDTHGPVLAECIHLAQEDNGLLHSLLDIVQKIAKGEPE